MANFGAQIIGPWTTDTNGDNTPAIQNVWALAGFGWENLEDITAQSGLAIPTLAPNMCVWQVDVVDELALGSLDADPRFHILSEWEVESDEPAARAAVRPEKPKKDPPGQPEWVQLRQWLRTQGLSNREIKEMLSDQIDNRSRRQIGRRLRLWLWSLGLTADTKIKNDQNILREVQHAFGRFNIEDPVLTTEFINARDKTPKELKAAIKARLGNM